jgi:hypothetical protein
MVPVPIMKNKSIGTKENEKRNQKNKVTGKERG